LTAASKISSDNMVRLRAVAPFRADVPSGVPVA
jgi:hypothetical protein